MNSRIKQLFTNIINEELIDTKSEFEQILSEKLNIALEEKKKNKKVYLKGQEDKEDEDEDDVEEGKMPPWLKKGGKKDSDNLDSVDKSELKGKHKDREDKDIDNDGDVDDSDRFLHKKRKAITKKMKKEAYARWQN